MVKKKDRKRKAKPRRLASNQQEKEAKTLADEQVENPVTNQIEKKAADIMIEQDPQPAGETSLDVEARNQVINLFTEANVEEIRDRVRKARATSSRLMRTYDTFLDQMCKIPKIGVQLSWFFVLLPFVIFAFVILHPH